jgi:hypothetical protein
VEIEEPEVDDEPSGPPPEDDAIVAVRSTTNAWWCPNDDTSMPLNMGECPTCGFLKP